MPELDRIVERGATEGTVLFDGGAASQEGCNLVGPTFADGANEDGEVLALHPFVLGEGWGRA